MQIITRGRDGPGHHTKGYYLARVQPGGRGPIPLDRIPPCAGVATQIHTFKKKKKAPHSGWRSVVQIDRAKFKRKVSLPSRGVGHSLAWTRHASPCAQTAVR